MFYEQIKPLARLFQSVHHGPLGLKGSNTELGGGGVGVAYGNIHSLPTAPGLLR